jgi:hypothetical protein
MGVDSLDAASAVLSPVRYVLLRRDFGIWVHNNQVSTAADAIRDFIKLQQGRNTSSSTDLPTGLNLSRRRCADQIKRSTGMLRS